MGEGDRGAIDEVLGQQVATAAVVHAALFPARRLPGGVPGVAGAAGAGFVTAGEALRWAGAERATLVASAAEALAAGLPRRAWELVIMLASVQAAYFTLDDWAALSETGLAAAEAMGEAGPLAAALGHRGLLLARRGQLPAARAMHARALALGEAAGDLAAVAQARDGLGLVCLRLRELPEAEAHFAAAARHARDLGDPFLAGVAGQHRAQGWLAAGEAARALETLPSMAVSCAGVGEREYEGNARWLLARARRLSGDYPAARGEIASALKVARAARLPGAEARWLAEAARVHLAAGDAGEALRCASSAAALHRQAADSSGEAIALDCMGEALLAAGSAEEAAVFHQQAARTHRDLADAWHQALALSHLGGCEAALGRASASQEAATAALGLLGRFADPVAARLAAGVAASLGD
ncbi:MAG TPA: hypothetical protein VH478_05705 [Trebonia sp.]|jgi:tetratricopeptide (TPR) repeat protein|nr:hypothetical protein [Trebonia sp.]